MIKRPNDGPQKIHSRFSGVDRDVISRVINISMRYIQCTSRRNTPSTNSISSDIASYAHVLEPVMSNNLRLNSNSQMDTAQRLEIIHQEMDEQLNRSETNNGSQTKDMEENKIQKDNQETERGGTRRENIADKRQSELNNDGRRQLSEKEAEMRFIEWYELICQERIAVSAAEEEYKAQIRLYQQSELSYQTRIDALERNADILANSLEDTQKESKRLKEKYEPTGNGMKGRGQPYKILLQEAVKLEDAKKQSQARIKILEDEIKLMRDYVKNIHTTRTSEKIPKKQSLVVITHSERLAELEKENTHLRYLIEKCGKERESLCDQIRVLEHKLKSFEIAQIQKAGKRLNRTQSEKTTSKKCVPTFLPKLESRSSGFFTATDAEDEGSQTLASQESVTRSGLSFGLKYGQLYKRRSTCSELSDSGSNHPNIRKYML